MRTWATKPAGFGDVERVVGSLDVLGHVDVRDVESIAVVVEAMRHAVGGKFALQRNSGQVEQVAQRVLVLDTREPAQAGLRRRLGLDDHGSQ
jgi:hypothetical protein